MVQESMLNLSLFKVKNLISKMSKTQTPYTRSLQAFLARREKESFLQHQETSKLAQDHLKYKVCLAQANYINESNIPKIKALNTSLNMTISPNTFPCSRGREKCSQDVLLCSQPLRMQGVASFTITMAKTSHDPQFRHLQPIKSKLFELPASPLTTLAKKLSSPLTFKV